MPPKDAHHGPIVRVHLTPEGLQAAPASRRHQDAQERGRYAPAPHRLSDDKGHLGGPPRRLQAVARNSVEDLPTRTASEDPHGAIAALVDADQLRGALRAHLRDLKPVALLDRLRSVGLEECLEALVVPGVKQPHPARRSAEPHGERLELKLG